jgi:hypothetical protein
MRFLYRVLAVGVPLCLAAAWAADSRPPHEPTVQGLQSVSKNVAKNPDNRGLQNARDRLIANIVRHETRDKSARKETRSTGGESGRPEQIGRAEPMERVERVDRPERVEKPERPERAERPDRPERGRGH